MAAPIALCRPSQIEANARFALENGVSVEELIEVATHLAFHAGFASAAVGVEAIKNVVDGR